MMEVKGPVLSSMKLYIPKKHGRADFEMWMNSLTPDVKTVYNIGISTTKWYSLWKYLDEPTQKYCDMFHRGDPKGAWALGKFSALHSLQGMYKIFMKMGSVEFIIGRAAKILPTFYRPSVVNVADFSDGYCKIHISEFPEISKLIEYRIAGWIEQALEIHGCSDVEIEITKSMTNGDDVSEMMLFWK